MSPNVPNLSESHISPNLTVNLTKSHHISSQHISLNLTMAFSAYLTESHQISPYITESCHFSSNLIKSHQISYLNQSQRISTNLTNSTPNLTESHQISPYLTTSHHISSNLTDLSLAKSHYISPYLTSNLTISHHISPTVPTVTASHRISLNLAIILTKSSESHQCTKSHQILPYISSNLTESHHITMLTESCQF